MGVPVQGLIGPGYFSISRSINAQRTVNLRLELDSANGKTPLSLVGLPGYHAWITDLPAGEVRGFWIAQDRLFGVVGRVLYEFFADATHAERAYFGSEQGHVAMADNGIHLMAVDGDAVIALYLASNVPTSAIANFPVGASSIICVDNTFIANVPNTQQFQISVVGDALTWRAIDTASAESQGDNIVSLLDFNRQVYMLGTSTTQVFWNSGDSERPFIPLEGGTSEVGCAAPFSLAKEESGVYWLGKTTKGGPRVYKGSGGQIGVISTPALDVELRSYVLDDAIGYTFRADGHLFYVLTFPTQDRTWVFDATAQGWYEFNEWTINQWHRHRSNCSIYAFGKQLVGDFENGRIYEMSPDFFDNDGAPLRALRASAHISQNQDPISVGCFEVLTEPGVGLTTGQGSQPKMMLRVSRDGGFKWLPEMVRSVGAKGEYRNRCRFNRPCGSPRDIVWELSITDPVKRVIIGAFINGQ